ncbi:hypothetical protein C0989_000148 [Termitomyces sp. Mn162]|nr:hypothetical protein C0989_000148 [Termitomyces sp. Mn162]
MSIIIREGWGIYQWFPTNVKSFMEISQPCRIDIFLQQSSVTFEAGTLVDIKLFGCGEEPFAGLESPRDVILGDSVVGD